MVSSHKATEGEADGRKRGHEHQGMPRPFASLQGPDTARKGWRLSPDSSQASAIHVAAHLWKQG